MTDLLDLPELLDTVVTSGRSRAIAAGVDANEYDAICASLNAASEWSAAFRRAGAAHRTLAEIAEQAGHRVTAGDAYLAAAACSHIATTVPTPDRVGDQEAADAMRHALTLLEPTFQQLAGPSFCGVLLTQPDNLHAPLVVIVPGLDSSQVEFHANAVALRRRGLATLTIDGPGQGALATRTVMRADYEVIVAEALDAALATGLRPRAIGLMGLSLGGFYGAVSLAREPRLAAGVTVSGPSRLDWRQLPPLLQAILTARAGSEDVAHTFTAQVDLADIAPTITQPLLVVDGELDVIPGVVNGEPLAALAPRGEHLLVPGGDHLVGNLRWQWLPRAAEFLQEQLA